MRKFDNIIQSETAPNTRSLWLKGNELLIFSRGTWRPLPIKVQGGDSSEDLPGGASEYVTMDYLNKYQQYITDIVFVVGEDNSTPKEQFEAYGYDYLYDHVPVLLVNGPHQVKFATLAMYYNGQITAVTDGKLIIYNVDYNDPTWPVYKVKTVDLTLLPTYVDLELGNSTEVKAYNREQLMKVAGTQFFVHADYGIGIGSWHPSIGGNATISTAHGDRVHYVITSEGECMVDDDHFDHSEIFFNLGEINFNDFDTDRKLIVEVTDSVTVHNFKKASNVTLELHTDIGVFDVICILENISMTRRLFLSPKIYADGENETTLRVAANIFTDKITFEITETTV